MVTRGTQAKGGTERIAVNIGPNNAFAFLFHPIKIPKEIPISHAIPNAMNTRFKLAQIWPARLKPLMGFSKNNKYLFQISRGDGKLLPFEDEA
jgi:hypothetical protein